MTAPAMVATAAAGPPASFMVVLALLLVGLALTGWMCVFRTDMLVQRARAQYERHGLVRLYPFSGLVMKDWYPTYLRCSGVFVWTVDAVLIYLVWVRKPR